MKYIYSLRVLREKLLIKLLKIIKKLSKNEIDRGNKGEPDYSIVSSEIPVRGAHLSRSDFLLLYFHLIYREITSTVSLIYYRKINLN